MFEINENGIDVVQVTGIGPHGINVMLLDNFYQNPDEVRELALREERESHKSAFGRTAFILHGSLQQRQNIYLMEYVLMKIYGLMKPIAKYMKNLGKMQGSWFGILEKKSGSLNLRF